MSAERYLTECGLTGIRSVPYGLHACHVYDGQDDLVDALVPYFLAGLYLGEKCLWIAARPLDAAEARAALLDTWPGARKALEIGALTIVDFATWYRDASAADPTRLADALVREEKRTLGEGYRALRVSGNAAGVAAEEHAAFQAFERLLNDRVGSLRMLALCSFPREGGDALPDVEAAHHCTFERAAEGWQIRWPNARALSNM